MYYLNQAILSQFPTIKKLNYLASCSQGLLPINASEAVTAYQEQLFYHGSNWELAMEMVEKARGSFAKLIGAESEDIAVVSSVSHAISAIVTAFPESTVRDEIIYTDYDFPTVSDILAAQPQFTGNVHVIHAGKAGLTLEAFEKYINEKTLLTMIPHVHYTSGFKIDVQAVAEIAHQNGSFLFVDAYQSAGHCPINVKEMEIDFLATGTRKYLLGIPGIAFLYINKKVIDQLQPRITGWLGTGKKDARKFDSGTPSFISAYVAKASLDFIQSIGVTNIASYLEDLGNFSIKYGQEKGLRIYGPAQMEQRSSLISFIHPQAPGIVKELREKHIVLTAKENIIRLAPHVYNTKQDIMDAIDEFVLLTN
ncbi:aminotransferase class V-fold PLP-dependent enzyme [Oceanobacillus sp. J11TS1]|uniref:aminotransferase class V-fold PLP-dependent enzyme n=1 Tax=Oceanobacillus sp. J11TS1 TaxID=2807191 RepID=UPI001B089A65|nr:aminotransferase class V-fold PLP-dependent enzyme [Oceanobacillus sp. J11TS1]GIO22692.1 putative aminotransferase YcbU [Oceanobacillus sp. J11TS1]